jgi:hypothetical protein
MPAGRRRYAAPKQKKLNDAHRAPLGLAAAIKGVHGVDSVAVTGMFCHTSPYAYWWHDKGWVRKELADLMIQIEIVSGKERAERALLIQTKMGREGSPWVAPVALTGLDLLQRELYSELPEFWLELDGRPKKPKTSIPARAGRRASPLRGGRSDGADVRSGILLRSHQP